jgi:CheY-like chemotaxis protein
MIALKLLLQFLRSRFVYQDKMNTAQTLPKPLINPGFTISEYFEYQEKQPVVLVAERKLEDRLVVKELLDLYNARIVETQSGEETVDLTVILRPDLIFIDSSLPGLNAFETARLIRSIYAFNSTPIVFLSDYPDRTERHKAFASGADDYMIKPLDLDRIDNIIEKYCY